MKTDNLIHNEKDTCDSCCSQIKNKKEIDNCESWCKEPRINRKNTSFDLNKDLSE